MEKPVASRRRAKKERILFTFAHAGAQLCLIRNLKTTTTSKQDIKWLPDPATLHTRKEFDDVRRELTSQLWLARARSHHLPLGSGANQEKLLCLQNTHTARWAIGPAF